MFRYRYENGFPVRYEHEISDSVIYYDSIVDDSKFTIDSENVRNKLLGQTGDSAKNLQYDTEKPSDLILALRSGKLDKAEIFQIQLKLQDELSKTAKDSIERERIQSELDALKIENPVSKEKSVEAVEKTE